MDVLRYSAENAKAFLQTQINQKNACITQKSSEVSNLARAASNFSPLYACWVNVIEPSLLINPAQTALWSCIPTGSSWTGGLTICGDDGQSGQFMSQGKDCNWVVPAGVTCARFQIWGAGGGAGSGGMCCSISPFGGTGAFVSVITKVTPGDIYCIHTGCAPRTCAYCTFQSQRPDGDKSFVAGPGLCNVCATGGIGELGYWMTCLGRNGPSSCYFGSKCFRCCGFAVCAQGSFGCWSATGVGVCCILPYAPAAPYFGAATCGEVYGIKGMFSSVGHGAAGSGNVMTCVCHPPVYGFQNVSCCNLYLCLICCGSGMQACCGFNRVPSAGASPSSACGGATGMYGDCSGRFGMVCICFK